VGISLNGKMVGSSSSKSNAVICSPGTNAVGQYVLEAYSFSAILPHATPGTSGFSVSQSNGQTVMMWTREANNGDAGDAQISATELTNVIWAIGTTNVFQSDMPAMKSTAVNLTYSGAITYAKTVMLTPGLTLNWNVLGSTLQFQAILNQAVWYVVQRAADADDGCAG
jgi:hypothetical protein